MACFCCDDTITVNDQICKYFDCYYEVNILWLFTITVCQYKCPDGRITTRRWRRILWWCKKLGPNPKP